MKYLLLVLGLLFLSTPAIGGEITRVKGDKSINFSFSGFTIEDYKYGIGGKYWVSDDITFTGSFDIQDSKQDYETTSGGTQLKTNTDITSYGISFGVEKHLENSYKLSPYIGSELRYLISKSKYDYEYDNNSSSTTIESDSTHYGIYMLLGVEYVVDKNIALAVEYSLGYSYSKSNSNASTSNAETSNKSLGLGVGKLILLFYF